VWGAKKREGMTPAECKRLVLGRSDKNGRSLRGVWLIGGGEKLSARTAPKGGQSKKIIATKEKKIRRILKKGGWVG